MRSFAPSTPQYQKNKPHAELKRNELLYGNVQRLYLLAHKYAICLSGEKIRELSSRDEQNANVQL